METGLRFQHFKYRDDPISQVNREDGFKFRFRKPVISQIQINKLLGSWIGKTIGYFMEKLKQFFFIDRRGMINFIQVVLDQIWFVGVNNRIFQIIFTVSVPTVHN